MMWHLHGPSQPRPKFPGHALVVTALAESGRVTAVPWLSGQHPSSWDVGTSVQREPLSLGTWSLTCCWVPQEPHTLQTSEDKTVRLWDSRGCRYLIHFLQSSMFRLTARSVRTDTSVSPAAMALEGKAVKPHSGT